MEVRFLDKGTRLDISIIRFEDESPDTDEETLESENQTGEAESVDTELLEADEESLEALIEAGKIFTGKFYDMERNNTFLVDCDDLYSFLGSFRKNEHFEISFVRGASQYTFNAGFMGTSTVRGRKLLLLIIESTITVSSRRMSPRVELTIPIYLHLRGPDDQGLGEFVFKGQLNDLSNTGLCLLSNEQIRQKPEEIKFTVLFDLTRDDRFILNAILCRKGNSPQSVQFKYDYGFVFEFDETHEERDRLMTAMFKYKLENITA